MKVFFILQLGHVSSGQNKTKDLEIQDFVSFKLPPPKDWAKVKFKVSF